jgi:hypothetical protein
MTTARGLSHFERLPFEILDNIFSNACALPFSAEDDLDLSMEFVRSLHHRPIDAVQAQ